ncbi:MAG TPA: hypothetical protein VNF46_00630 [Gammaproteobacteria bacterium]|nr:hypothetical protein [Gammaproteobacteria bacterium]
MKRIIILLAVTILGGVGWELGTRFGFGMAWLLSSAGSLIGVYIGWRIGRAYLD